MQLYIVCVLDIFMCIQVYLKVHFRNKNSQGSLSDKAALSRQLFKGQLLVF